MVTKGESGGGGINQELGINRDTLLHIKSINKRGLPRWLCGEESARQAGDSSSITGSGISPGKGNDSPLQYSCLGNPLDRGACQV